MKNKKAPLSQQEYEQQEIDRALRREKTFSPMNPAQRQSAHQVLLNSMRDPAHVAANAELLLKGDYGYGEMLLARQPTKRMNRAAILMQLLTVYDHDLPRRAAIDAWKQLTKKEQRALQSALEAVLKAHDAAVAEDQ